MKPDDGIRMIAGKRVLVHPKGLTQRQRINWIETGDPERGITPEPRKTKP